MSIRVSASDVEKIMTDLDASLPADLSPFIRAASLIVDNRIGSAISSTDLLFEIERWLAAHLVAIDVGKARRRQIDTAEEDYGYSIGKGLDATPYGQQVKLLDTTGQLSATKSFSFRVFPDPDYDSLYETG